MLVRETTIEKKLVKLIEGMGGRCVKGNPQGNTGFPDRLCILPGGITYYIETKKPKGGQLSEKQKYWGRVLKEMGHKYSVCSNEAELYGLGFELQRHGRITR